MTPPQGGEEEPLGGKGNAGGEGRRGYRILLTEAPRSPSLPRARSSPQDVTSSVCARRLVLDPTPTPPIPHRSPSLSLSLSRFS